MEHLTEVSIYDSTNYVVLDFETTNNRFGSALDESNSVLLSCWTTPCSSSRGGVRMHSYWGGIYSLGRLISDIEAADFIVCHNAKFELQWLARAGLDLSKVAVFDTLIAEYVLNGGLGVELGLGAVAKSYGYPGKEPYVDICMKGRVCPSDLPKSLLERRCKYDVAVTHQIFLKQLERLRSSGQLPVLWTRCILTPVLADIEKNGMALDKDRVNEVYEATLRESANLQQQLEDITGGINLNSAKQRAEFLYDKLGIKEPCDHKGNPLRTSAGGRKTDQETILSLKGKTKEQKNFLELYKRYATLNAKLTKSLNTYKEVVDSDDLLHAQFNQARTRTQRLSSTGFKYSIQFQNQAREFKPLFRARNPDWLIAEIDGAQLEFRVAAFLGQDSTAVHDIENGFDVHSHTAKVMTDAGQPTTRQEAKSRTFKPLIQWRFSNWVNSGKLQTGQS